MKKLMLTLLAALLTAALAAASAEGTLIAPYAEAVDSFSEETVTLYMGDENTTMNVSVYFINGMRDIPYFCVEDWAEIIGEAAYDMEGYSLAWEKMEDGVPAYILTRENGAFMLVSFRNGGEISFSDMDLFFAMHNAANGLDVITLQQADADPDNVDLLQHKNWFYRLGGNQRVDLSAYDIFPVWRDGKGYLPVQTLSDIVMNRLGMYILWNDECLIATNALMDMDTGEKTKLGEIYEQGKKGERSDALIQFTYNELCMALDRTYGLMEEHSISSFDTLFCESGMGVKLFSKDAGDVYTALTQLTMNYFEDGHSTIGQKSYRALSDEEDKDQVFALITGIYALYANSGRYEKAAAAAYPDGIPGYEEVGNTAYITFDAFKSDPKRDYYSAEITNNPNDTIELILYANRMIHRENSPVENVVIDLTNNGGGSADAAICVTSWFLGNSEFSLENVKTGTFGVVAYRFDANLDHVIDEEGHADDVTQYRRYCLISPASFSCGNLVPAAFKASDQVTLIGHTSGGGACVVGVLSTADGNTIQLSSQLRVNTVNNGIYYSVDHGVDPDYRVDKIGNLYNRQALTDYINGLF